jgi:hypothetical protein
VLIGPERDADPGNGVTATFKSETLLGAVPWIEQLFATWAREGAKDDPKGGAKA